MSTSVITSSTVPQTAAKPDRIAAVAREFESLFSSMMLKAMRGTAGEGSLVPASMGEKIYTSMLDDEYAGMLASGGELGLASVIEKEMRRLEAGTPSAAGLQMPAWMIDNRMLGSGTAGPQRGSADVGQLSNRVERWGDLISSAAQTHGVDRDLVAAVIAQESGGNPYALSRAGAKGLMQLMDATARNLGVRHSFDPARNVDGGVRYLRQMLDKYDGDERLALASYNAGPGAVDKYNGVPPYPETRQYVQSVLDLRRQFAVLGGEKE